VKIADIYSSGILTRDEKISCFYSGTQYVHKQRIDGIIILTTNRFLFVQKPPGLFSKGLDVVLSFYLDEIVSVSTSGLLFKKLRISVQSLEGILMYVFSCDNTKDVVDTMLFNKNLDETESNNSNIIIDEKGRSLNDRLSPPKKLPPR
jgi:hypothetical protein